MNEHEEEYRQVNVRFTEAEIAAVRDITKVDALAPAVRAGSSARRSSATPAAAARASSAR